MTDRPIPAQREGRQHLALSVTGLFLIMDGGFFCANMVKIFSGGWFPLAVAGLVFALMSTWKRGRSLLRGQLRIAPVKIQDFLAQIDPEEIFEVPGTAVFMNSNPYGTPSALQHNLKHNRVMHKRNIILTVLTEEYPFVPLDERVSIDRLGRKVFGVKLRYGFMEKPDVPRDLSPVKLDEWAFRMEETTFFLGRENIVPASGLHLVRWREKLFIFMSRNPRSASSFFNLPPNRVVELGVQVMLNPAESRQ
jgi:KUP system potassium uptake protein